MAKEANVLLTPAIITGPWDLWPPGTLFPSPGTIKLDIFFFFSLLIILLILF